MRVNDAFGMLESARRDWSHLLLNPRSYRNGNIISWRANQSFFFSENVTYLELIEAVEQGQYSFQLVDGSIVQIYYNFGEDGRTLLQGRLAYYGSPDSHRSRRSSEPSFDLDSRLTNWLRFDFNRAPLLGILESACHLQIGGLPRSRLMVNRMPTPKQFIELLMSWCYPREYRAHRLDARGNYRNLEKVRSVHLKPSVLVDEVVCGHTTHVSIPG
jgi:hypothetical protein